MTSHVTPAAIAVERHAEIAPLAPEWDALADRLGSAPFLRPGWFEAWLDAFASEVPAVLAARCEGELVGVLPMLRRRGGVLAIQANSHTPFAGAIVDGPDAADALAKALLEKPAARTDLTPVLAGDLVLAALRTTARGRTIERVVAEQPYVDTTGSFDDYEAALPRKHRKEVGRLRRRLAAEGELSFEFADGTDRLDALLDEGFAIEGSGWKTEAGTAINSFPEARRFYTAIAKWAAAQGWLRLAFLRLDGRAIAFDYCLEAAGSFYALKGGFDTDFRKLGPGVVLAHESLARAFANDAVRTYEFLGVADSYKLDWTSTTHERVRLQLFSRSPRGYAQYAAWQHGRPLVKDLRARLGRS